MQKHDASELPRVSVPQWKGTLRKAASEIHSFKRRLETAELWNFRRTQAACCVEKLVVKAAELQAKKGSLIVAAKIFQDGQLQSFRAFGEDTSSEDAKPCFCSEKLPSDEASQLQSVTFLYESIRMFTYSGTHVISSHRPKPLRVKYSLTTGPCMHPRRAAPHQATMRDRGAARTRPGPRSKCSFRMWFGCHLDDPALNRDQLVAVSAS